MSFNETNWAGVDGGNYGLWDGNLIQPNEFAEQQQFNTMYPNQRRNCRIVCDPPRRPMRPPNLQLIGRSILGKHINQARTEYPYIIIRAVINNGVRLPVTQDFIRNRINVELSNNIIIRIISFN